MPDYITRVDIESTYGASNVAKWANLDNEQASDGEDRIDAAIAYAEEHVNNRFRGSRYTLPLTATAVVKQWVAKIAGAWLYSSRGFREDEDTAGPLSSVVKTVETQIDQTLLGALSIDSEQIAGPTAPIVVGVDDE
jgi:phage gp36-like protein